MSGCCLGDVVAALVDGELDDAARERAHRHLAHCAGCRAEVEAQRRVKARLSGAAQAEPSSALTDRLLRLGAPPQDAPPREVRPPSRPAAVAPVASRPDTGRSGSARPTGPRARVVRRRATTGSAIAVLGVTAALALGAPQPRPATTLVDPTSEEFVTEFMTTTTADGSAPAVLPAARTSRLTTFVPLTRSALLSTGGARSTR